MEAGVKIIKRSLTKSDDGYRALQSYRATPLSNGFSPAELLMGRRIRTTVPMTAKQLEPKVPEVKTVRKREEQSRKDQKYHYDKRHRARDLPELREGDRVWIIDLRRYGRVKEKHSSPRSYIIERARRTIQRNRFHLVKTNQVEDDEDTDLLEELKEEVTRPEQGPQERPQQAQQ